MHSTLPSKDTVQVFAINKHEKELTVLHVMEFYAKCTL